MTADYEPSAADVKALRERTGAGVLDCRAALKEAGGDLAKAVEILRVKGQASAAKRSGRATGEGTVASFVHDRKVGALVEVRCETDFVARGEDFQEFAREVALHIAGAPSLPQYVSADEIPDEAREAERAVHEAKAREDGKPDDVIAKIVDGQLAKWAKEVALLDQEHIHADRYEGKTIEELRAALGREDGREHPDRALRALPVGEE